MKIKSKAPENINYAKIYKWQEVTPINEGLNIIFPFVETAPNCNWVLFYAWCYARTNGFTDSCLNRFDVGNHGGNFASYRDGVQNSLSFFLERQTTAELEKEEETETLRVYYDIVKFCDELQYDPAHPLPMEPIPLPPDAKLPETPGKIEIPIELPPIGETIGRLAKILAWWRANKTIIIWTLSAAATIAGFLFSGPVKLVLLAVVKFLENIPF